MEVHSVQDAAFAEYGRVLEGYDVCPLLDALLAQVTVPETGTVYEPSLPSLEALPAAAALRDGAFGGLDIQIGHCSGRNNRLTCLEYHRTSEVELAATDMIFLLARQPELERGRLDSRRIRAFFVPNGTVVELFATTLHYAPCGAAPNAAFCMGCVLPRGTNLERPAVTPGAPEDRLLWGRNKWVIAGPGTPEAAAGAFVGITGDPVVLDYQ